MGARRSKIRLRNKGRGWTRTNAEQWARTEPSAGMGFSQEFCIGGLQTPHGQVHPRPVFVNAVLLEHSSLCPFVDKLSLATFVLNDRIM